MNHKAAISVESMKNSSPVLEGVRVLVVDGDSACLTILTRMLCNLGYKVMTAQRASDALSIAQKKEDELHLVLTEAHLPDMDTYELLEKMKAVSKLPVVIMSDDDDESAILGGLFKGAVYYFVKPLTINNLKNLWQFAFTKNRDVVIHLSEEESSVYGESQRENTSNEGLDSESFTTKEQQSRGLLKRKNPAEGTDKDEERDDFDSPAQKKPKLVWTHELHKRFLQAVRLLGVDCAQPKKILQHMNVPGLRKENVSSHLQKYRLSLKREQEAIIKTRTRDRESSLLSFHSSPSNFQGGFSEISNRSSTATALYQPEFRSHFQNLSSHNMSRPSPAGSVCFPSHFDSSGQPALSNESRFPSTSYHIGSRMITRNKELAGFRQVDSFVGEGIDGNKNFSSFGDHDHSNLILLHNSIQEEEQQQQPPPPPLQVQQENDIFGLEKQLLLSPQLQMPSMPAPPAGHEQENDIFGNERGEADDLFDIAKVDDLFDIAEGKTQQFHDFDSDDFW